MEVDWEGEEVGQRVARVDLDDDFLVGQPTQEPAQPAQVAQPAQGQHHPHQHLPNNNNQHNKLTKLLIPMVDVALASVQKYGSIAVP